MHIWSFFSCAIPAEPIDSVGRRLDEFFTYNKEHLGKTLALARVAQQPALVQAEINKTDAEHRSGFVSGRQPFISRV